MDAIRVNLKTTANGRDFYITETELKAYYRRAKTIQAFAGSTKLTIDMSKQYGVITKGLSEVDKHGKTAYKMLSIQLPTLLNNYRSAVMRTISTTNTTMGDKRMKNKQISGRRHNMYEAITITPIFLLLINIFIFIIIRVYIGDLFTYNHYVMILLTVIESYIFYMLYMYTYTINSDEIIINHIFRFHKQRIKLYKINTIKVYKGMNHYFGWSYKIIIYTINNKHIIRLSDYKYQQFQCIIPDRLIQELD